jgi:UDP-glucose 4-epimerase
MSLHAFNRVLVTGGAGFIGSHLVNVLVKTGYEVVVFDNFSTGRMENVEACLNEANFSIVNGDVRDRGAVNEALKEVEAVFHLAAITSVPYSIKYPRVTREVNVGGTRNLLEACVDNDVERFNFVSTCAVYGEAEYLPIDEKHPTRPVSPYAESKLEAENLCLAFQKKYGLNAVVFRLFNVYGSRMREDQYGTVIIRFIKRLMDGKPPIIYGDGEQTRDFVHAADTVNALMLALNNKAAAGETFNIGFGTPVTVNRLARLLIELFKAEDVKPVYRNKRSGDIRNSYADIHKARDFLGFKPSLNLEEGLSMLLREFKKVE